MLENLFHKPLYYVYIAINDMHSKWEVGLAGSLQVLLRQWAGDNNYVVPECYHLVYHESFTTVRDAMNREEEFKRWPKQKLYHFIERHNPEWRSMNKAILEE